MQSERNTLAEPARDGESATRETDIPYRTAWEHLSDELRYLAMRIGERIHARRDDPSEGPLDAFKGLVLSGDEMMRLLRDVAAPPPDIQDEEARAWRQSVRQADGSITARRAAAERHAIPLPLPRLAHLFQLSRFEERTLILALAPELDLRFERIYGFLQDDVTKKRPTAGLALDLFCEGADDRLTTRVAFDDQSALAKYQLCQLSDEFPGSSLSRSLKLDPRVLDFLTGRRRIDRALDGFVRVVTPASAPSPVIIDSVLVDRLVGYVTSRCGAAASDARIVVQLTGRPDAGTTPVVEAVCRQLGTAVVVADLEKLFGSERPFADAMWRIGREALLQGGALCLEGADALTADADKNHHRLDTIMQVIEQLTRITFVTARRAWKPRPRSSTTEFVEVAIPLPDATTSKQLWTTYLARENGFAADVDPGDLAVRFRVGSAGMCDTIVAARHVASWRAPEDANVTLADVTDACRSMLTHRLSSLGRRIAAGQSWSDIILPADQLAQLQEIATHARFRPVVFEQWGFARKLPLGKGLSALFTGPPGTGKTMAARLISAELGLDLYQIDLSQVVSKYIGETEKNLHKVFDEADASQTILFFDEADALFGRRSEVKDAHDRYANIEIGYLLQRMEEYEGISILASNMRQNLDEAFVRRLRFIVEFPFPDEEQRRRIWGVAFPAEAPLADDVDLAMLARELKLAGGNIKNIALAAAFAAAADRSDITMAHLIEAARREHQKLGRSWRASGTTP
jgi:hypothetical protein